MIFKVEMRQILPILPQFSAIFTIQTANLSYQKLTTPKRETTKKGGSQKAPAFYIDRFCYFGLSSGSCFVSQRCHK